MFKAFELDKPSREKAFLKQTFLLTQTSKLAIRLRFYTYILQGSQNKKITLNSK